MFADLKTTEVADAEKKEGGYVIRVAEGKTFPSSIEMFVIIYVF